MFVRKKKIKGREYYYVVKSTRKKGGWKKIERYVGLYPPSQKDLDAYTIEFNAIKEFLIAKNLDLEKIKSSYLSKLKSGKKDELHNIEEELITKFTYDTSRIEGSSLTYKDTKMLLQEGISPREKPLRDVKEAENHKKAYLFMKDNLNKDISNKFILQLHGLLKKDITVDAGSFRDGNVSVGDLVPVKPELVLAEIANLLRWYKGSKQLHPLELCTIFHCNFERIHPFFDGNGRVGRLLLNFILLKNQYPLINIQNKNKRRYYNALRRADKGNYLYMIKYLFSEIQKLQYWR